MESEYKSPLDHASLVKSVQTYLDVTRENARLARRDRDYFDGDQISDAVKSELAKRGQPAIYTNKVYAGISGLLGIYDASASDPEAYPRTVECQGAADIATKTLRYLSDAGDFPRARKIYSKPFFVEGIAAALLEWTGDRIAISPIHWEDFIYDPYSREYDFSDAKWLGVAKLMDADDARQMFPDHFTAKESVGSDFNDFFDDKSKRRWWNGTVNQVRVIDIYCEVGGEWHRAIFTQTDMLFRGPSEYRDDRDRSIHPIRATSFEIKRNGDRYGAVRHMVPLQDEVNARRSRLLHLTNHRQVRTVDMYAVATDKEIARREASKADGVMPFGYEPISAPDLAQGQMLILQQADADLDRMCPTPAVLGRLGSSNESGRARQVLQQAGYTELARGMGRLEALELSIYRLMWAIARQFLDQPTWIRVGADQRAPEFLQINEPVMGLVNQPVIDPMTGQQLVDPMTGAPAFQPVQGAIGMNNRLAELDMDILITTTPDTINLEQEVFNKLLETAGSTGVSPFDPRFLAFLEMAPLPNKKETIERIERRAAQAAEQEAASSQAAMALAQAQQKAEIDQSQAKATLHMAQAEKALREAGGWQGPINQPLN